MGKGDGDQWGVVVDRLGRGVLSPFEDTEREGCM